MNLLISTSFYHTNRSSSNLTNFTSLVQFVLANLTNSNLTATGLVRIWLDIFGELWSTKNC